MTIKTVPLDKLPKRKILNFRENDPPMISLFGDFGWEVNEAEVLNAFSQLKGEDVEIRMNTDGGDIFTAFPIYNLIAQYPGKTTMIVDNAFSAGSFTMLAADERVMNPTGRVMIHNVMTFAGGSAADMRAAADMLDDFEGTVIDIFEQHLNASRDEISEMMNSETFFNAQEAVDMGFATRVAGAETTPVENRFEAEKRREQVIHRMKRAFYSQVRK